MSRTTDYIVWLWETRGINAMTDESIDAEGFDLAAQFKKETTRVDRCNDRLDPLAGVAVHALPTTKGADNGRAD